MGRNKYHVTKDKEKRTYEGFCYDSVMEMKMYRDFIQPKLESGEYKNCEKQVVFSLQNGFNHNGKRILPITYIADFVVTEADGHIIVFDCKGRPDNVANIKKKLFYYKYPEIDYRWYTLSTIDGGWRDYDDVKKLRRERKRKKQGD